MVSAPLASSGTRHLQSRATKACHHAHDEYSSTDAFINTYTYVLSHFRKDTHIEQVLLHFCFPFIHDLGIPSWGLESSSDW